MQVVVRDHLSAGNAIVLVDQQPIGPDSFPNCFAHMPAGLCDRNEFRVGEVEYGSCMSSWYHDALPLQELTAVHPDQEGVGFADEVLRLPIADCLTEKAWSLMGQFEAF